MRALRLLWVAAVTLFILMAIFENVRLRKVIYQIHRSIGEGCP